jgi:hypothetical protein
MTFEGLGKSERIAVSDAFGHLIYTDGFVLHKLYGHFHPVGQKIFLKRVTGRFFKESGKIASVKSQ